MSKIPLTDTTVYQQMTARGWAADVVGGCWVKGRVTISTADGYGFGVPAAMGQWVTIEVMGWDDEWDMLRVCFRFHCKFSDVYNRRVLFYGNDWSGA